VTAQSTPSIEAHSKQTHRFDRIDHLSNAKSRQESEEEQLDHEPAD
jgi:hypothetical protein